MPLWCGQGKIKLYSLIYNDSDRRELKYGEKDPSHYCCVWQKSHMDLLGLNPSIWQDRPATNRLNQCTSSHCRKERRLKTKHGKAAKYEMDDSERKTCLTTVHCLIHCFAQWSALYVPYSNTYQVTI